MKHLMIAAIFLVLVSCGKTNEHAGHDGDGDNESEGPNKALYDQVMSIHDEVMPKMEDVYKVKKDLLEKLSQPGTADDKKKAIEDIISKLDSTNDAMMDWMHNFNPLPDTVDQEAAREYLETEMERIKKVRDMTNETLVKAKAISEKK